MFQLQARLRLQCFRLILKLTRQAGKVLTQVPPQARKELSVQVTVPRTTQEVKGVEAQGAHSGRKRANERRQKVSENAIYDIYHVCTNCGISVVLIYNV